MEIFSLPLHWLAKALVQKKGKDLAYVKALESTVNFGLGVATKVSGHIGLFEMLDSAGRDGDPKVRLKYLLNGGLIIVFTLFSFALWKLCLGHFFFEDFGFKWYITNGRTFTYMLLPIIGYAFFLGNLDWFCTSDPFEKGTVTAERMSFKTLLSANAGIFEEWGHRGIYIYYGLISVAVINAFFGWVIMFTAAVLMFAIVAMLEVDTKVAVILVVIVLILSFLVKSWIPPNAYLSVIAFIFGLMNILAESWIWTKSVFLVTMIVFLLITVWYMHSKEKAYMMGAVEFGVRIIGFTVWASYAFPIGIKAIGQMPILPPDANQTLGLMYVGAVLWSNAKFRDAHKYQGPAGMLNSYIIGFYMFAIAFTCGLLPAMVAHFLFDFILFGTEHIIQFLKNRPWRRAYASQ